MQRADGRSAICNDAGAYIYRPEFWFQAQTQVRVHRGAMRDVRTALTPTQLAIFRETCFGPLLDIGDLRFSAVSLKHKVVVLLT